MAGRSVLIKPILKISKKQFNTLLERVLTRSAGRGMEAQGPRQLMQFRPPNERLYGRLQGVKEFGGGESVKTFEDLPYGEAMSKYVKNRGLTTPATTPPTADVLTTNPPRYERRIFKPLQRQGETVRRAVDMTEQERAVAQNRSRKIRNRLRMIKGVEKSVNRFTKSRTAVSGARSAALEGGELDTVIQQAGLLDIAWRHLVKGTSVTGRMWNNYRLQAPMGRKVENTKDYFISTGLKWLEDPQRTTKRFPRESKSLATIWQQLMDEMGGLGGGM